MSAGSYNITCEQGATFSRTLTVKDSNGAARNLSSYTARMQVRRRVSDTTTLIELTTENGRITLNENGEISLSLSASLTSSITDDGVYDLEIIASDGTVERVIEGSFTLSREVTR